MNCISPRRLIVALLCMGVLGTDPLVAQVRGKTAVSAYAGRSEYDLSGVGWTAVYGVRVDRDVGGPFVAQFALPLYRYNPYRGSYGISYLLPELSVLLSPRVGPVSPYLGVGPGWSFMVEGGSRHTLTLHAALGLRIDLVANWDVRGEFLARSIDPWHASTADISGGVGYRF